MPKPAKLGIDAGAPGLGMFVLFQYQDTRTFAQDETIPVLVPGAGGRFGVIVAGGQCPRRRKAANAQRRYG
jgi:hypothetical protein